MQPKNITTKTKKDKLAILLYLIPVLFFIASYFFNTVSAEDLFQGAGTFKGGFKSIADAFFYNGRISDIYAWFAIKYFNYQFEFGVDIIFRIIDVVAATGIIYLITRFCLGRKLQLNRKDAFVFNFSFVILFLSLHGRSLYSGFSLIHNYIIISLSLLLICLPIFRKITNNEIKNNWKSAMIMLVGGTLFGFSSNLAPLALLMSIAFFFIYAKIRKLKINWKTWLKPWAITTIIGTIIGIFISFFVGPGVSTYVNGEYSEAYDYISFSEIFQNPKTSIARILKHEIINFGRVLWPLALILIVIFAIYFIYKKRGKATKLHFTEYQIRTIEISTIYMIAYTLTMSQIFFPYRLALPAYVGGMIATITICIVVLNSFKKTPKIISIPTILCSACIMLAHATLEINYSLSMRQLLTTIKNSEESSVCVDKDSAKTLTSPHIYMTQEDMLIEQILPITIYDKEVTFCKE